MLTPFLALEPRVMTRWDAHKFARDAYNAGIRYIGGCCGIEPYHIRAVAEEVTIISLLISLHVRCSWLCGWFITICQGSKLIFSCFVLDRLRLSYFRCFLKK